VTLLEYEPPTLHAPEVREFKPNDDALLRQIGDPGHTEGALWAGMRIHRIASDLMVNLGYSSKLNAEWDFLCMLRDAGRAAAESFLAAHGADLGQRSSYDLDVLLKSV